MSGLGWPYRAAKPAGSCADFGEVLPCPAGCVAGTFWEDHTPMPTHCEHCGEALAVPRPRKALGLLGRRPWPVAKALHRGLLRSPRVRP